MLDNHNLQTPLFTLTPPLTFSFFFSIAREPLGRGFTLSTTTFLRLYESLFLEPSKNHSLTCDVEALERELKGSASPNNEVSCYTTATKTTTTTTNNNNKIYNKREHNNYAFKPKSFFLWK